MNWKISFYMKNKFNKLISKIFFKAYILKYINILCGKILTKIV